MRRTDFDWMREVQDFSNRVKDYFENLEKTRYQGGPARTGGPVDVYMDASYVYVEAELPGMKKEEIRITTAGGALEISGEKQQKREPGTTVVSTGRRYGSFNRRIELPPDIDLDLQQASASYTDGVLRVVIPKIGSSEPEISINIE